MGTEHLGAIAEASIVKNENSSQNKKQISKERMLSLLKKLPELGKLFDLHWKVGEGTFSNVYLATFREVPNAKFAVKHLTPTCHPTRVISELKCMQEMGGKDNVVRLCMCLRMQDCITFVMPYQQHDKFSSYLYDMNINEIRLYIRELCVALRRVHSFGVIHRDVKPGNFLYSRAQRRFLLVDFGLAQKVGEWMETSSKKRKRNNEGENEEPDTLLENTSKRFCAKEKPGDIKRTPLHVCNDNVSFVRTFPPANKEIRPNIAPRCDCDKKPRVCNTCLSRKGGVSAPRAGTPGFRAPEVLLKSHDQTTAVDMWAVGVILLCLLSRTYPFFRAPDDVTGLAEMISVFGSEQVKAIASKLGRHIVCSEICKPLDLRVACTSLRAKRVRLSGSSDDINVPDEAYFLLNRLLDLDHTSRITADETLSHPFITGA